MMDLDLKPNTEHRREDSGGPKNDRKGEAIMFYARQCLYIHTRLEISSFRRGKISYLSHMSSLRVMTE